MLFMYLKRNTALKAVLLCTGCTLFKKNWAASTWTCKSGNVQEVFSKKVGLFNKNWAASTWTRKSDNVQELSNKNRTL